MGDPLDKGRRRAADPMAQSKVVLAMQAMLPSLATKKRQAAEYFLSHPDQVAFLSLRKIALAARVSTGIVMKLLHDLGYQSYEIFKSDFQELVAGRYDYYSATAETATHSVSKNRSLLAEIAENDMRNIKRTVAISDASKVRSAAEKILSARKVFVIGMRVTSAISIYLTYQLTFVRDDVVLLGNDNETLVESLADLREDDVLIAISFFPYTSVTADVVKYANGKNLTIISLTDRENSPVTTESGMTFIFAVESSVIFNSITACLVLAQALVVETLMLSGNDGLKRIKDRSKLLQEFGVFGKS